MQAGSDAIVRCSSAKRILMQSQAPSQVECHAPCVDSKPKKKKMVQYVCVFVRQLRRRRRSSVPTLAHGEEMSCVVKAWTVGRSPTKTWTVGRSSTQRARRQQSWPVPVERSSTQRASRPIPGGALLREQADQELYPESKPTRGEETYPEERSTSRV